MLQTRDKELFLNRTIRQSILHEAVLRSSVSVLGKLLALGMDPGARNSAGETPLMALLRVPQPGLLAKIDLLRDHGSPILTCDVRLKTTFNHIMRCPKLLQVQLI
jgi:hypothetical protein